MCSLLSFCQLRSQYQDVKNCPVVAGELFEEDDFFSDIDSHVFEDGALEKNDFVTRLQNLIKMLGVRAFLGLLSITETCSSMYTYLQGLLYEKK